jgi:hypothetical protein
VRLTALPSGVLITTMDLPRTNVGFSSTDAGAYLQMTKWKALEGMTFDFRDCKLAQETRTGDEAYIKELCRERLRGAGAYIMLIGDDTLLKNRYVQWEAQVARTKGCKMICVNLNHARHIQPSLTPAMMTNVGAMFVPFSPLAVQAALECDVRRDNQNYELASEWYESHGYELVGDTAVWVGSEEITNDKLQITR